MPRYRVRLAYVGTNFHGWQTQTNAPRTVQAVLESALARLAREPVRVEGAGSENIHFSNPVPPPGVSKLCSPAQGIPPASIDGGKQP